MRVLRRHRNKFADQTTYQIALENDDGNCVFVVLCLIFAMLNDRLTKILNQLIKLNASTEDRSKE